MGDFRQHCEAYGLLIRELIADGRPHAVPTADHPRKKNGRYLLDSRSGWCQNWATMTEVAVWKPDGIPQLAKLRDYRPSGEAIREERARHAAAAAEALLLMERAEIGPHPYLEAKGFPNEQGFVADDLLVVPMRDFLTYKITSAQTIDPGGKKMFLAGGRAKGAVFRLGAWKHATEIWFAEGLATAYSVRAALADLRRRSVCVVVCFSAGNLQHVASAIGRGFVVADNDASGAGCKAAEATGLPWCMPPDVGLDLNYYHQKHGLRAAVKVLLEVD